MRVFFFFRFFFFFSFFRIFFIRTIHCPFFFSSSLSLTLMLINMCLKSYDAVFFLYGHMLSILTSRCSAFFFLERDDKGMVGEEADEGEDESGKCTHSRSRLMKAKMKVGSARIVTVEECEKGGGTCAGTFSVRKQDRGDEDGEKDRGGVDIDNNNALA